MHIRDYEEADLPALERIHVETGYDYKFQDMESPLVLSKKVLIDDEGRVLGIYYSKLQAEVYLTLDPNLGTEQKVDVIAALDHEVSVEGYEKGLDQHVCYLPPGVESHFKKRLKNMGWSPGRPDWKLWVKDLV